MFYICVQINASESESESDIRITVAGTDACFVEITIFQQNK